MSDMTQHQKPLVERVERKLAKRLDKEAYQHSLGVDASHIGKNDIGIKDRKISGGAQCVKGGYILHHGTLMFDVDISILEKALTPDPEKLKSSWSIITGSQKWCDFKNKSYFCK